MLVKFRPKLRFHQIPPEIPSSQRKNVCRLKEFLIFTIIYIKNQLKIFINEILENVVNAQLRPSSDGGREIVANALISTLNCSKICSKYAFVKIIAKMLKYAFWHILRHRHNATPYAPTITLLSALYRSTTHLKLLHIETNHPRNHHTSHPHMHPRWRNPSYPITILHLNHPITSLRRPHLSSTSKTHSQPPHPQLLHCPHQYSRTYSSPTPIPPCI